MARSASMLHPIVNRAADLNQLKKARSLVTQASRRRVRAASRLSMLQDRARYPVNPPARACLLSGASTKFARAVQSASFCLIGLCARRILKFIPGVRALWVVWRVEGAAQLLYEKLRISIFFRVNLGLDL